MKGLWVGLILTLSIFSGCSGSGYQDLNLSMSPNPAVIALPPPKLAGEVSLEEALVRRRSIRDYTQTPLNTQEISQLLWAAQGITSDIGGRTAPSAGALYPLEIYLVVGLVEGLAPGIYKYKSSGHELTQISYQDIREELAGAALRQSAVRNGAIDIVISAVYERTTQKYGDRGIRYVDMEAGHAAQNLCIQATALELGAVTIGAFDDQEVKSLLNIPDEDPLYIIPVGHPK